MRREHILQALAVVVLAVCAVAWFSARQKLLAARALHADGLRELDQARAAVKELQDSVAKARTAKPPVLTEAETLELARLRNEVTRLRGELRTATNQPPVRKAAPVTGPAAAPTTPLPVTKLTSTVTAQVPLGNALAIGGWAGQEPGQRVIGFITPVTVDATGLITSAAVAGAPGQVLLQTHLMTVPDRFLDRLGLQDLRTDQPSSQTTAGLDAARFAALLKLAEQETGVSVLSAPRVLTTSGRAAQVSVTQPQPDGTHTGPVISLTPTLDATGASVRLDVNLELTLSSPARP